MIKKEYDSVKVGDKIRIKMFPDMNRVIKVGTVKKDPWFKFNSAGKDGFMIGTSWYPYQKCEIVKEEEN